MAKSQYPVDGVPGKAWKVTSPFGWRMHPIKKVKKHHNGVDIWQGGETTYLEAWADGKVIAVKPNDSPTSGGHSIIVQSTVMGKKVTWTYFHMVKGQLRLRLVRRLRLAQLLARWVKLVLQLVSTYTGKSGQVTLRVSHLLALTQVRVTTTLWLLSRQLLLLRRLRLRLTRLLQKVLQ